MLGEPSSRSLFADDRGSGGIIPIAATSMAIILGSGFRLVSRGCLSSFAGGVFWAVPFFCLLVEGAWEGNACRKSAGTVRDGCLYLSVERRVVKTVCRLFCRGFGKMARVYELLLLRRSLGRYRGKSGYSAMTPDPTSSSPSYQAANCPGVIPR